MNYNILATRKRAGNYVALIERNGNLTLSNYDIYNMFNVGDKYTSPTLNTYKTKNCMYKNKYKATEYIKPTHIITDYLIKICENDIILVAMEMYIEDNTLINFDIIDEI